MQNIDEARALFPYESLELLDIFLSKAPIGFALIEGNHRFTHINHHLAVVINKKSIESHIGRTVRDALGATIWKLIKPHVEKALSGQIIHEQEISFHNPENSYVSHSIASYFPIKIDSKIVGVGVVVRDVTKHKETELALSLYKDRLEQAQRAGKIGVFDWDMTTDQIWWSEEEESIFGVPPGKFKGTVKDWFKSVYPDDLPQLKEHIKAAVEKRSDLDVEFRVMYPGDIMHWIRGKGHIYYNKKTPVRMVGVNYDITSRKNEEQLLKFKAESARIISSTFDYKKTLADVANLAIKYIADWCSVDMINEETGEVELLAVAHKDPSQVRWARKLREETKPDMSQKTGLPQVLKTGKSEFYPYVTSDMIKAAARNKKELAHMKKIGFTSVIIVPITTSKKVIGAITFVSTESKRQYTHTELQMADQLGSRAGLAIDNVNLYEQVREDQLRLDDLLANVPAVVWESWGDPVTQDQKITYISSHAERLLGYKRDEWLTIPNFWLNIVHPDDRKCAHDEASAIYLSGTGGVSRFRWVVKGGRDVWVESQSTVIKDSLGTPIGMRGVTIDITNVMEDVRRKDEFISMASHELKTPITSIKAFTQILKGTHDETKRIEYLTKMESQIERLSRLIFDFLDVSKIQEGKLPLQHEQFSLNGTLKEVIENLQMVNSHQIIQKLDGDVKVLGDPDRIEQVIINLITNAIKYSPNAKKIVVKTIVSQTQVIVEIKDFGVGIAPEHQNKIFNRFYRIHNKFSAPGLGIGLYISQEIVKRHGGTMWVQSVDGKGSSFFFTLPIS